MKARGYQPMVVAAPDLSRKNFKYFSIQYGSLNGQEKFFVMLSEAKHLAF
jgi:hypothetical protein